MYIVVNKSKHGKKIYSSILLCQSYREGKKVRRQTIANLSSCTSEEISAIRLALQHKDDLGALGSVKESVNIQEGLSVGAVWAVYQVARELGIEKALGSSFDGKLALWQIMSRVIDQGSRLSSTRLANLHASCETLGFQRGFDENNLYDNLKWLSEHQEKIEKSIFEFRRGNDKPKLFLYDVTSSYLEGDKNYFGAYGYNRDKKKGKKQIVIGLLCDEKGVPVSTEVFSGNTTDPQTVLSQIEKVAKRFECQEVTFVGDRGMIKTTQINDLTAEKFHYITAITKIQINTLIKTNIFQLELFDEDLCEIAVENIRYILKRNPVRAAEISETRRSKRQCIEEFVEKKNLYLIEHSRAAISVAAKDVQEKIKKLKLTQWLRVLEGDRNLILEENTQMLKEESELDGCYVIKTDLLQETADKHTIHDRYKDLAYVEKAFRDSKTVSLEMRPIFVRTKDSTQGHILVVMLSYMIIKKLREAWARLDMTVAEGLKHLTTLCSMQINIKGHGSCLKIPKPREKSQELLEALGIQLPKVLPARKVNVVTRKKLQKRRKPSEK
jgi:transposase